MATRNAARGRSRRGTRRRLARLRKPPATAHSETAPPLLDEESSIISPAEMVEMNDLIQEGTSYRRRADDLEKDGHTDTARELARIADGFFAKAEKIAGRHRPVMSRD